MNTDLLIAVLSLAGLQIGLVAWLRSDMRRMEDRLSEDINALRKETGELRERMAHLEGLLEGLREAITLRSVA